MTLQTSLFRKSNLVHLETNISQPTIHIHIFAFFFWGNRRISLHLLLPVELLDYFNTYRILFTSPGIQQSFDRHNEQHNPKFTTISFFSATEWVGLNLQRFGGCTVWSHRGSGGGRADGCGGEIWWKPGREERLASNLFRKPAARVSSASSAAGEGDSRTTRRREVGWGRGRGARRGGARGAILKPKELKEDMEEYQHERELEEKRGEGGRREYLDKRKTR